MPTHLLYHQTLKVAKPVMHEVIYLVDNLEDQEMKKKILSPFTKILQIRLI